jgi:hypothetical protein
MSKVREFVDEGIAKFYASDAASTLGDGQSPSRRARASYNGSCASRNVAVTALRLHVGIREKLLLYCPRAGLFIEREK